MKKKPKKNPHCPVAGCRATKPHLSSPTTAGIHHAFSGPEQLALWIKLCLAELVQSVIDDVNKGRYFAYLTRWRQPEEMYHRALYMLFVADKPELPHIASGDLPNSFSQMWKEVNRVVYDGKGTLDQKQLQSLGASPAGVPVASIAQSPRAHQDTIWHSAKTLWRFLTPQ